jgi:hypothetical protein
MRWGHLHIEYSNGAITLSFVGEYAWIWRIWHLLLAGAVLVGTSSLCGVFLLQRF